MLKLAHWFKEVEESGFKSFSVLMKTIMNHYNDILNYFECRSTNASAESFNAKIKNFRLQLRGVRDKTDQSQNLGRKIKNNKLAGC